MIAGPYSSGGADARERAVNLKVLNQAALEVFRRGHIPVVGVNMALPLIEAAGGGAGPFSEIMMPLSLALSDRCDAILRVGGLSLGADQEVERIRARGGMVFMSVADIPQSAEKI